MIARTIGPRWTAVAAAGCLAALVACSSPPHAVTGPAATEQPTVVQEPGPSLAGVAVAVPPGMDTAPFDQPREIRAPAGWTVQVWARVPGARLMAWTPDGKLLVSRPSTGDVVALTPGAGGPAQTTLVAGLTQPHGLAFAGGSTLYVAESDQVDTFAYRAGAVADRRVVVPGLPDAKSPELGGAYAHALKSVAVGPDGAVYISVGSTGNVSAEDRDADAAARLDPARAARRRGAGGLRARRAQRHGARRSPRTGRCGRR